MENATKTKHDAALHNSEIRLGLLIIIPHRTSQPKEPCAQAGAIKVNNYETSKFSEVYFK